MRKKILTSLASLAAEKPLLMFSLAIIITVIAAGLSTHLELSMHFKKLMPQSHPMVKEFNQIIEDYSTASMIIIAATGEEKELKNFAEEVVPQIRDLKEFIQRIDYKVEKDFFLEHGMMLQKAEDLKNLKDIYQDLSLLPLITNINNSFEKEYVQDDQSISTREKENTAVMFLDNLKFWLSSLEKYVEEGKSLNSAEAEEAVDRFLIGEEYYISQDKDMLLIFAQPTFTLNEMDQVILAENSVDSLIHQTARNFPSIFAGTTGTMALSRDETVAASEDMYVTSIIAFVLIIALFILSFRMLLAPVFAGLSLFMGIIWTAGFASITLGTLNIMTSMFSVILVGLGVDFSIHIISVYTEKRSQGLSNHDALQETLLKSGSGVITGAFTTACAFLTLTVSESAGMSEFGIVAGSGVLFCMAATLIALPAMLSLRDKLLVKIKKEKYAARTTEFKFLGKISESFSRNPVLVLIAGFALTAILLYSALNITFDYNYLNMEPVGLTSIKLQDEMIEEFDVTPDFALVTTTSIEESRQISEGAKDIPIVGMVSSISEYIPSPEEQERRIPHLQDIEKYLKNNRITRLSQQNFNLLMEEMERLKFNIIELAQLAFLGGQDKVDKKTRELIGNLENETETGYLGKLIEKLKENPPQTVENLNHFQTHYEPRFRKMALRMASQETITLEKLPQNIVDQYISKSGNKFLVTIYPKEQVWNLAFLERFSEEMQELDSRVTGIPNVFFVLIQIIAKDGQIAAVLTLIVVFLLLYLDFRKFKYAMLAMTPLIVGAIWMVGTMKLFGLQLTMVNVMGIPLILGIGIDDGVHLLHRYRAEGFGKIRAVFISTGRAVLLTSLTTMLAFGSLKFATYRGLGSLGIALFIGVGTCFLTSVVIIPALLGLADGKRKSKSKNA